LDVATSVHGVPVRLTDERWRHIVSGHPEVSGHRSDVLASIREPDAVVRLPDGALVAIRRLNERLHVVVPYREAGPNDGFIITGWLTSTVERWLRREVIWRRT